MEHKGVFTIHHFQPNLTRKKLLINNTTWKEEGEGFHTTQEPILIEKVLENLNPLKQIDSKDSPFH